MVSPFLGLDTALRGLRTSQRLVDVTTHNVANANTPGFSRQSATIATTLPYPVPAMNASGTAGQVGTGVEVTAITRARDTFTDYQLRGEMAGKGSADVRRDSLSQIEAIYNEPTATGLSSLLGKYWHAWQEVANSPSDLAVRSSLVEGAQAVVDGFRRVHKQLFELQQDTDNEVRLAITEVNQIAAEIAAVNQQVAQVETAGLRANDLRDRRDLLLDRLSRLARVTTVESAEGATSVYLAGRQLVDRTTVHQLEATTALNESWSTVRWAGTSQPVALPDGSISGLLTVRDTELQQRFTELNAFAQRFVESVNAVHHSGVDLAGAAGGAFFTGTDAASIGVRADVLSDPNKLAAARQYYDTATATWRYAPGDGSNALAMAQLQQMLGQRRAPATLDPDLRPGSTRAAATPATMTVLGMDISRATPSSAFTLAWNAGTGTLSISNGTVTEAMSVARNGATFVFASATLGVRLTASSSSAATTAAQAAAAFHGDLFSLTSSSSTLSVQYGAQVAALGVAARAAKGDAENQEVLVNHLKRRRDETSGVSLDEETTNLMKFQHAYQAAARMMSTVDEMLEILITSTGRVGR